MRLLAGVSYGRIVFTEAALPAIRPVNHLIDDGQIVIRAQLSTNSAGVVVAYEADELDPGEHTGWSVVVTGIARTITDPARLSRYRDALPSWVDGETDTLLTIEPSIVTGTQIPVNNRPAAR